MSTNPRFHQAVSLVFVTGALMAGALSAPALAEGGDAPTSQYANLPPQNRLDPGATGSLPSPGNPALRNLSSFYSFVERGAILVRASAPTKCLPGDLREVVAAVAAKFGPVSVESTHRSRTRNRKAGGARQSLHLACRAIDFRVRTRARGVMAYLRSRPEVGGLKVYRNGIIHIDNGQRRSW
ncbi:YcbK family protein [Microvirga sp. GCM10011540]|uniref:YcbK family protein n=1 Tax=Microvirga sp. GCM10011540 TaxID=3317338 RepID=UPI003612C9A5